MPLLTYLLNSCHLGGEGKKTHGMLLHETWWQGRVMRRKKKDRRNKRRTNWRAWVTGVRCSCVVIGKAQREETSILCYPPRGFFTSFWLSPQKIGPADVFSLSIPSFLTCSHQIYHKKKQSCTSFTGKVDFNFTRKDSRLNLKVYSQRSNCNRSMWSRWTQSSSSTTTRKMFSHKYSV